MKKLYALLMFYRIILITWIMAMASVLHAQTFPTNFSQVAAATGISNPTVMAFAPDGRIFVAQQDGTLIVIKNGIKLATPAIRLTVDSNGERGLIGIALHPGFSTNGFVYLYYTLPNSSHNRVSRFTMSGDVISPSNEVVILNLDALNGSTNHNGGAMHFKGDKLYIAVGENANSAHAQNLDTYHGKILRVNADGSAPTDNPFYTTTASEQRKRVWSLGLRNPYTFDIQPGTGKIFVNDVGQNAWEEINDATAPGLNFGWPTTEGPTTNPSFTSPLFAYQHGSAELDGCAVTGGVFFNPATTNYPASFIGKYFFQDLCWQWINYLDLTSGVVRKTFGSRLPSQSLALDVGTDGNIYYLSREAGTLYKIIYSDNILAPAITAQPGSITVSQGQPATFTVSATGAAPLTYQWRRNNVNITGATGSTYTIPATQPANAGNYQVIVSNSAGSVTSQTATLTVTAFNAAPTASITLPSAGTLYRGGDVINFSGTATDPEDGALPASAFTWSIVFHHADHVHDGPPIAQGTRSGSYTIPNSGETAANVFYRLHLTVTDSQGLTNTRTVDVTPRTTTITLASNPAGLSVTLDGQPATAPFSTLGVEGIQRTIGVVSPQTINGQTYSFTSWTHGGTASQTITTPEANTTYTANFSLTDNTAPTVPINLTSPSRTATSVNLVWTASTDNVAVTGYDIYNGTALAGSSESTTFSIPGLTAGTTYSFTVRAKDAAGNVSAASTVLNVTTLSDTQAPSTPGTVTSSNITVKSVRLAWGASTDNVGVTAYDVYNGSVLAGSTASRAFNVTRLTPNTTYSFTVRARDAAGNTSASTAAHIVTTPADTQAPTTPGTPTASTITTTSIRVTWTASTDNMAIAAYDLYNGSVLVTSILSRAFIVTGLAPNTTYSFTVRARDAAGNTSASSTALIITTTADDDTIAPTVPTNLTSPSLTATSVSLAWAASTDAVGVTAYDIYRGTALAGSTAARTFTVTGLTASTAYSFTVRARDAAGNTSAGSTALSVTTSAASVATSYRYLRIVFTGGSTLEIADVKWLFNTSASYPTAPLTSNGTRVTGNVEAFRIYDNALSGGLWIGTPSNVAVTLDMITPVAINVVAIQLPAWGTLTSFRCEGSNDNSTWTLLHSSTGISQSGVSPVTYNFTSTADARISTATPPISGEVGTGKRIVTIFPNPSRDILSIKYNAHADKEIKVSITNMSKMNFMSKTFAVKQGDNLISLPVTELGNGVYLLFVDNVAQRLVILK